MNNAEYLLVILGILPASTFSATIVSPEVAWFGVPVYWIFAIISVYVPLPVSVPLRLCIKFNSLLVPIYWLDEISR